MPCTVLGKDLQRPGRAGPGGEAGEPQSARAPERGPAAGGRAAVQAEPAGHPQVCANNSLGSRERWARRSSDSHGCLCREPWAKDAHLLRRCGGLLYSSRHQSRPIQMLGTERKPNTMRVDSDCCACATGISMGGMPTRCGRLSTNTTTAVTLIR